MAGRRRVPARSAAGLRRPLLRHPGGKARGVARIGYFPRQIGARKARGAGPRPDRTRIGRRSAAVRGAVTRSSRGAAAERGGKADRSAERPAPRRNVAARRAGSAVCAEGETAETVTRRSPDGAKRNPGTDVVKAPGFRFAASGLQAHNASPPVPPQADIPADADYFL